MPSSVALLFRTVCNGTSNCSKLGTTFHFGTLPVGCWREEQEEEKKMSSRRKRGGGDETESDLSFLPMPEQVVRAYVCCVCVCVCVSVCMCVLCVCLSVVWVGMHRDSLRFAEFVNMLSLCLNRELCRFGSVTVKQSTGLRW